MESPRHTPQAEGRGAPRFGSGLAARRRRAVPAGGFPHRLGAAVPGIQEKIRRRLGRQSGKNACRFAVVSAKPGRRLQCLSAAQAARQQKAGDLVLSCGSRGAVTRRSARRPPVWAGCVRRPPRRLRRGLEVGVAPSAACGACPAGAPAAAPGVCPAPGLRGGRRRGLSVPAVAAASGVLAAGWSPWPPGRLAPRPRPLGPWRGRAFPGRLRARLGALCGGGRGRALAAARLARRGGTGRAQRLAVRRHGVSRGFGGGSPTLASSV